MILEAALRRVRPSQEDAFRMASPLVASSEGYISRLLSRCVERTSTYLLLVRWRTLEDHVQGFRNSAQFLKWRRLLHHFYDPAPSVEHFMAVVGPF